MSGLCGDIVKGFLGLGIMRLSLALMLPWLLIKVHGNKQQQQQQPTHQHSRIIEVPHNFCELDRRDECGEDRCLRYDPKKFPSARSAITYFPGGRLGNMLSAFLTLLWVHLETGQDVYYERESHKVLDHYFEHVAEVMPVLEDKLCDWKQFPFKKYEGDVELLGRPEWRKGKAVQIFIDKSNFMRHEIQGGRVFYKKYRKEAMHALTFRRPFKRHAEIILEDIKTKFKASRSKTMKPKSEITFIGVHNRRTDYLEFRNKRLGLENLYEDYFQDAMEYFREEYENTVFLYVSDDMKWGRRNMREEKKKTGGGNDVEEEEEREGDDLFFVGCGDPDDLDCIGKDLAVLSFCNHTITSQGSYGHWASYLAGGEIYTEYGAIVPDAYV